MDGKDTVSSKGPKLSNMWGSGAVNLLAVIKVNSYF